MRKIFYLAFVLLLSLLVDWSSGQEYDTEVEPPAEKQNVRGNYLERCQKKYEETNRVEIYRESECVLNCFADSELLGLAIKEQNTPCGYNSRRMCKGHHCVHRPRSI